MQLEKKDVAKSKIEAAKSKIEAAKSKIEAAKSNKKLANAFAPRQSPAQMCRALSNEMPAIHIPIC
jgi:hypothetical protein